MKSKESLKLVSVTKNSSETALKKVITEKISTIISSEHNKT